MRQIDETMLTPTLTHGAFLLDSGVQGSVNGPEVLASPRRFLARVADAADPESDEMRVLVRLCTPDLLGPFRGAVANVGVPVLRAAETRARIYLEDECRIEASTAAAVASGIAKGVAIYLGPALRGQPQYRPHPPAQASSPQQKRSVTMGVTPGLQRVARSSVSVSSATSNTGVLSQYQAGIPVAKRGQDIHVDLEITEQEARDGAFLSVIYNIPSTGARDSCEMTVPAGSTDWSILMAPGMGDLDPNGGPRGDLLVFLRVMGEPGGDDSGVDEASSNINRRTMLALAGGGLVLGSIMLIASAVHLQAASDGRSKALDAFDDWMADGDDVVVDESLAVSTAPFVAISAGRAHTVGLRSDGILAAAGSNKYGQCTFSDWNDIVAISAGGDHTVGLRSDGTAVATGNNWYGQCSVEGSDWSDLIAVSAGAFHTVGLRSDGTAVAKGLDDNGQCAVSRWSDLVAVSAGSDRTVGLHSDGTLVFTDGKDGSHDIVAVSDAISLRSDGTVVSNTHNESLDSNISDWSDIVAVSASSHHAVGLRSDGTVVASGRNDYNQCDVSDWQDIVAVSAGEYHTVGLCSNGIVVAAGWNDSGQCDVSGLEHPAWFVTRH